MRAKRWWAGALLVALAFSTGCCGFWERHCAPRPAPACGCACYVPCVPTTAAAAPQPAAGWNAPTVPCVCPPVAVPAGR